MIELSPLPSLSPILERISGRPVRRRVLAICDGDRVEGILDQLGDEAEVHSVLSILELDAALELRGWDLVLVGGDLPWAPPEAVARMMRILTPECPIVHLVETDRRLHRWWQGNGALPYRTVTHETLGDVFDELVEVSPARRSRPPAHMRGLLNRIDIGVFCATMGGRLIEANPAFLRLLGLRPSSLLSKNPLGPFFADAEVSAVVDDLIRSSGPRVQRELKLSSDGPSTSWVSLTLTLTRSPVSDDRPAYLEGMIEDISDRKRIEEQLRDSHLQLRQLADHLQTVREEERSRIAIQIHDELGQLLTVLKLDLSALERLVGPLSEPADQRLRSMSEITSVALQTVRRISTELRPRLLDELGLVAAIEWTLTELASRTELDIGVDFAPDLPDLPKKIATTLYRILQELVTNVVRHAEATRLAVCLFVDDGHLVLEVDDNGRGIDPERVENPVTFGLHELRERAHRLGGSVTIEGGAGRGTWVEVRIPLAEAGPPDAAQEEEVGSSAGFGSSS